MLATEARAKSRTLVWEALGIVALSLAINLAGNGRMSLWDRDEPRYAECTREMRVSGDYVHPRFNAEPRYQKPVLIYWLMALGMAIGGDNPFGARLVSSIAGAASCLVVWFLGGRMFDRRVGRIAALALATAPIVVINSKLATTDATLAFLLIVSQACLWKLAQAPSTSTVMVFWASLALATLTKGPVAIAMIGVAAVFSWALGGPTACWRRLQWRWGLALFALITAPWFIAIGIATRGEFFRVAVGSQVLHRVATGMEEHGGFPGYYPATTMLSFYPWSALLPAALFAAFTKRKTSPAFGFLLGWAIGPMILLECVRTKLVHYYLPAYPACVLLVAWLISAVMSSERNLARWPFGRLAMGLFSGVGLTLLVLALGGAILLPWDLKWPCLAMAVVIGVGTFFATESFRTGRTERGTLGLAGTWALALGLLGAWMLPAVEPYRLSQRVVRSLEGTARTSKARPILATFQEPSMIFALGAPTLVMRDKLWLMGILREEGAAVSALSPTEMSGFEHDPNLSLSVQGTISGFNLSKGRTETLELVVIRLAESSTVHPSSLTASTRRDVR